MKSFWEKVGRRLTSKVFWVTLLIGLVPLLAQDFGWTLISHYDIVINLILGLLVTAGLLHNPDSRSKKEQEHWKRNI